MKLKVSPGVLICTYESLQKLAPNIDYPHFDQIILDEVHLVSHKGSKRFKAVEVLLEVHKVAGVQTLSGTPIQHKPRDLWAIYHFLSPKQAGSYEAWVEKYERVVKKITKEYIVKDKSGKAVIDKVTRKPKIKTVEIPIIIQTQNLDHLHERLKTIMFRVKRRDYTDFKDSVELITVELTDRQRRLYREIKNELLVELKSKKLDLKHTPVRMLRLLQAAEGLFNFDRASLESGKLEYCRDVLKNTDQKILCWSRFQPATEILGAEFKDKAVIYNGNMSDNYKTLAKWAFNGVKDKIDLEHYKELLRKVKDFPFGPGEAQFFFGVINIRSSLGMDLHKECSHQLFLSWDWMPNANMQAADRLRRIGQEAEEVVTQFLVAENTWESKALALVLSNYNDTLRILDGKNSEDLNVIRLLINTLEHSED